MSYTRELTAREKRAIRRLVTTQCANYDHEYECLPLDGACYMFTIAFNTSSLCKYFKNGVLPLDPTLEAVFTHRPVKPCQRCGKQFPLNGRQAYCSTACTETAKKAATTRRVQKHRKHHGTDGRFWAYDKQDLLYRRLNATALILLHIVPDTISETML